MIIEIISYSLQCDYKYGCNKYYDGKDDLPLRKVIRDAESENWRDAGLKIYCPDHRPNMEEENE